MRPLPRLFLPVLLLVGCTCENEAFDLTAAEAADMKAELDVGALADIDCLDACASMQGRDAADVTECALVWPAGSEDAVVLYEQNDEDPPEGMAEQVVGSLECDDPTCG